MLCLRGVARLSHLCHSGKRLHVEVARVGDARDERTALLVHGQQHGDARSDLPGRLGQVGQELASLVRARDVGAEEAERAYGVGLQSLADILAHGRHALLTVGVAHRGVDVQGAEQPLGCGGQELGGLLLRGHAGDEVGYPVGL